MPHTRVPIDLRKITDWSTFHSTFARAFGFPKTYGRNMEDWTDTLATIDDPETCTTRVQAPPGGVVELDLRHVVPFAKRCPGIYEALVEGTSHVNHRRGDAGPILALSFDS